MINNLDISLSFSETLDLLSKVERGIQLAKTLANDVPLSHSGMKDLTESQSAFVQLRAALTTAFAVRVEEPRSQGLTLKSLEEQFEDLKKKFPLAILDEELIGYRLLTIPAVPLPLRKYARAEDLEFQDQTTMHIRVPSRYPWEAPDRFFTPFLKLSSGAYPLSVRVRQEHEEYIPKIEGAPMLWLWQIKSWDPYRDTLKGYVLAMCQRFLEDETWD